MAGLALTAILYLPSLFEFDNYTVAIFYRWWTVHLWVEGVWEMIQGRCSPTCSSPLRHRS